MVMYCVQSISFTLQLKDYLWLLFAICLVVIGFGITVRLEGGAAIFSWLGGGWLGVGAAIVQILLEKPLDNETLSVCHTKSKNYASD